MIEQRGNKTWHRAFKSFYKIAKKGRVIHVAASMAACLTIAATSFAADFSVNTAVTATEIVAADGDTLTITNSGSITVTNGAGNAEAVASGPGAGDNNTIINSGSLSATATNADAFGIEFDEGIMDNMIFTNTGSISASSPSDNAYGFDLSGLKNSAVSSSGTITVNAKTNALGISSYKLDNASITNSGVINVSGTDADGMAANVYGMQNSSRMENAEGGSISVTSTTGAASGMVATGMGGISGTSAMVNDGWIMAESLAGGTVSGMFVNILTDISAIMNSGQIDANGSGTSNVRGIFIAYSDPTAQITNSGTITLINSGSGPTIGILNQGTAPLINTGTIKAVNGSGALADNMYSVDTAGSVTNSGTLKGKFRAGDTTNSGLIQMPPVTSTITGNFTQTISGTMGITLFSDDNPANTQFSKLTVSGTTNFANGSGIDVDVTTASAYQDLLIGQTLTGVIQSPGGITAEPDTLNTTDNSVLLKFVPKLSSGNTSLDLDVEKAMSILAATISGGGTGVTGAAGSLDTLTGSSNPQITAFINDLNTLSTEAGLASRVQQAAPVNAAQVPTMATQVANTMSSVVQARQQSVRGFNSGDTLFSDRNFWLKPFAVRMDQDDVNGVSGFSADALGIGIGADGEYSENLRLGLAFFYTRAETQANKAPQESDLDVLNLMFYGSRPLTDPSTNIFFLSFGGVQFTESSRYIQAIGMTATADYTAKNLFAQTKATKKFELTRNLKIIPGAALSYTWFYNPSFEETGAGGMNLSVDSFDAQALVASLEGDMIWSFNKDVEFMASASLGYDLVNDNTFVGSRFQGGGAVFQTQGIDNSPVVYSAGVGLAKKFTDRFSLDAKYDLEGRGGDFMSHMVSAKLNWKF